MSRIIAPKSPVIKSKPRGGSKRNIYSIYDRQNNPFTIVLNEDTPDIKSTLVAFVNHDDAYGFSYMLECHKKLTYEWPYQTSDLFPTISIISDELNKSNELLELRVCAWERDVIKSYCKHYMLDLLLLSEVDLQGTDCTIKCLLHTCDPSYEDYIESFTKMYDN
jgi:hypothetical protein